MSSNSERDPLLQSINSDEVLINDNNLNYGTQEYILPKLFYRSNKPALHMLPGIVILFMVLLERTAYYSLTGNMYLFLHQHRFHWLYYNAMSALLIFTGLTYVSSLLGGWLSDAYFGRFKTIGFAFIIFSLSYWFLSALTFIPNFCSTEPWKNITCTSCPAAADVSLYGENCSVTVMSILILGAVGTGVMKANITPFGAEQVRHTGPDGLKIYLNWFYWCVNIGAFIAILGITYVQQEEGFFKGYIIPATLLTSATLLFWASYPLYTHQTPSGSPISRIYYVVKEAWKSKHQISDGDNSRAINRPDWLDMAKVRYGGIFHEAVVEDVKSLSAIIKVFISLIPYWMLYFQMQSTFLAQGLQMRLNPFTSNSTDPSQGEVKFTIPAAWLNLFNVIFLIIFIPLLNYLVYPFLKRRGIEVSMLTRMGIGMFCAALSMIVAGCLELCRVQLIDDKKFINQTIENTTFVAADISILWQIPQYSLIGISEVFASVSGMEFACSQAPSRMQGAVMGLYYFCTGIGSFLGVATLKGYEHIFKVFINHFSGDINQGKLYYYFFFLASVQLLAVIIFVYVSKSLKIRRLPSPTHSRSDLSHNNERS